MIMLLKNTKQCLLRRTMIRNSLITIDFLHTAQFKLFNRVEVFALLEQSLLVLRTHENITELHEVVLEKFPLLDRLHNQINFGTKFIRFYCQTDDIFRALDVP